MTDLSTPIVAMPSLQRRFEGRALRSLVLTTLVWFGALLAAVPLISVLYMLITRGGALASSAPNHTNVVNTRLRKARPSNLRCRLGTAVIGDVRLVIVCYRAGRRA